MREHFKAFDDMRTNSTVGFIGEMIWNFADFMTKQGELTCYTTLCRPIVDLV